MISWCSRSFMGMQRNGPVRNAARGISVMGGVYPRFSMSAMPKLPADALSAFLVDAPCCPVSNLDRP